MTLSLFINGSRTVAALATELLRLRKYKEQYGDCNVPIDFQENPRLARWVSAQRTRRNKGSLSAEQIRLLDELGFVWDFQTQKTQETWMKWYQELERYVREHGNAHVPKKHTNRKLASWVWIQRTRRDRPYGIAPPLTPEQFALLDKLGFRWDAHEEKWIELLDQLKRFKEQRGHWEVGFETKADQKLRAWMWTQRRLQSQGRLASSRKGKLDAIGFAWTSEAVDLKWRAMYDRLKQYHALTGNPDVPLGWKQNQKLATWVKTQRARKKADRMTQAELHLLEELNFTWQHAERGKHVRWEDRYQELVEFEKKHGHCDPPNKYPESPKLRGFVNSMRFQRNSGKLSADRIAKLDAIGFAWSSRR